MRMHLHHCLLRHGKHSKLAYLKSLGLTKPSIRRLAYRGGIARLSRKAYTDARNAVSDFLKDVIQKAACYVENESMKTMCERHVHRALKLRGMVLYR